MYKHVIKTALCVRRENACQIRVNALRPSPNMKKGRKIKCDRAKSWYGSGRCEKKGSQQDSRINEQVERPMEVKAQDIRVD